MMKNSEKIRLESNLSYIKKVWEEKKSKYKLYNWKLRTIDTSDKAGVCSYNDRTIYLSTRFMRGHNCDFKKIKQVLMHEIAHALNPGHSHDSVWKRKCAEIGGDCRLAVTMVELNKDWAVCCPKCKWRQDYDTKPKYDGIMVCGKCHTPVKISYVK